MMRTLLTMLCLSVAVFAQPARSYRIAGTVVDIRTGKPLGKTRVVLITSGTDQKPVASDIISASGRFSFDGIPAGKYMLNGQRVGYPGQGFEQHEIYVTGIVVAAPGQDSEHLVFKLKPAASISGRVTDEFQDPVREADVLLFYRPSVAGEKATRMMKTVKTDDQGVFHLSGLPEGKYYVAVNAQPWYRNPRLPQFDNVFPFTFYGGVTDDANATPIKLAFGQRAVADIALRSMPGIHVRLTDSAFRNVRIMIPAFDGPDIEAHADGFSGRMGNQYVLSGLAPGRYVVEYSQEKAEPIRAEVEWAGDSDLTLAQVASRSLAANVSGTAIFDGGRPDGLQAELQLHNIRSGVQFSAFIADDGKFAFDRPVPPGIYSVTLVSASDFLVWAIDAGGAQANGTALEISRAGPVQLSVVATRTVGNVEGTALRSEKGASGCMIVLVPENTRNLTLYRRDQSDSDGTFALRSVLPGNYTVIAIDSWDLEWTNPDVLKKYVANGVPLHVSGNDVKTVKVPVQPMS